MKSNTEQLAIAKSYLGQGGAIFRKFCGLPSGAAWCNAFVSYIFAKAGNASLYCGGAKETYCPHSIKWCYNNLASIPIYLALPSDVIYFDWENNGVPNHIGFVRERKSCDEIYTIEGNTDGGRVANKIRTAKYIQAVFRPHYKPTSCSSTKILEVDGLMGYNTIAVMQRWVGVTADGILGQITVKALQKKVGVTADGLWGNATSKALQKYIGVTPDGLFGVNSVKALQTYLNKNVINPSPSSKPAPSNKVLSKAKELAWPKGTKSSTYAFSGGKPTSAFKKAFDKVFPSHNKWGKGPKTGASCDVAAATCVRASGVEPGMPRGYSEQIKYTPKHMQKLVFTDVAPYSVAKPGDMVDYTKNASGSERHVIIMGENCFYEAQYQKTYLHCNTDLDKVKTKRPKVWIFREK